MFERVSELVDPVSFEFEGRTIQAERGESLAMALLAAGVRVLARSPKLHRPRNASCLRGSCDGCLARVSGVPNVMLCQTRSNGGESVSVQNVLGSPSADLLRLTDWFFPNGIDHHHLLAGVPGVGEIMQTVARQMAGIGRLPTSLAAPAERIGCDPDVLVVGAGIAGITAANALSTAHKVLLVDENPAVGGAASATREGAAWLEAHPVAASVETFLATTVVGAFDGEFVLGPTDPFGRNVVRQVRPRAVVIATGAHDHVKLFVGNDLPGVMSARSVAWLASRGVLPKSVFLVGKGPFLDELKAVAGPRVVGESAEIVATIGSTHVTGVELICPSGDRRKVKTDVVAVDGPLAPTFELGVQIGLATSPFNGGFALSGKLVKGPVLAVAAGECAGVPFDPNLVEEQAARAAAALLESLGGLRVVSAVEDALEERETAYDK